MLKIRQVKEYSEISFFLINNNSMKTYEINTKCTINHFLFTFYNISQKSHVDLWKKYPHKIVLK